MSRREFPARVKVAVIKRATRDKAVYCEKCGALAKRWQIDHIRPDGLLGEPVIENAMLICEPCWQEKNPQDTKNIAQAKRREAKNIGAVKPKGQIANRGFVKAEKPERVSKTMPPRRPMFEEI
jgi:5-methylcytosine-specific restriction enzyme A